MWLTKNFREEEFFCKCGCGTFKVCDRLINRLQMLRESLAVRIVITSGCRCWNHNHAVGGKPSSYHLVEGDRACRAVDISCVDDPLRFRIIETAVTLGFLGIGIGPDFVHLDVRQGKPKLWHYYK